jgi:hypothetical protein
VGIKKNGGWGNGRKNNEGKRNLKVMWKEKTVEQSEKGDRFISNKEKTKNYFPTAFSFNT